MSIPLRDRNNTAMKTKELVLDSLLAALLFVVQTGLAGLPNIELVSLLLILYTLLFGRRVFLILYTFVILEGLVFGFGLWWISYLYVWAILCLSALFLGKSRPVRTGSAALLSGFFGMSFGMLCAFSYLLTGGPGAALAWWVAGIPFDILHGISNFFVAIALYRPLYSLLYRLKQLISYQK